MSMTKGHMMKLIQELIHDEALSQLKKKRAASPHDPPQMNDDELDIVLFHGGMNPISESFDNTAKIGTSDISEFENQMHEMLSNIPNAVLTFDKQPNGYSILLKNGNGAVDVMSSGKITFGNEGEMTWMFSIPNGLKISTKDIKITQENRDIFSDMFNYYNTWQKTWRQKLLAPNAEQEDEDMGMDTGSMQQGAGAPQAGEGQPNMNAMAQQGAEQGGAPMS